MSGRVDLNHSRRGMFLLCKFWNRDESNQYDLNEYVLKKIPDGQFYAKIVNNVSTQQNPQSNVFMFDKNTLTIESHDDLNGIERGSVVLCNGHAWFVENIQCEVHQKETEFNSELEYIWWLALRR